MTYRGAVFDMDGLMFDTERLTYELQKEILASYGIDYKLEWYKNTIGKRADDIEGMFIELCGEDFSYEKFREECRTAYREYTDKNGVPAKPGLFEALEKLKDRGVKIALATSTTRRSAERTLRIAGVLGYFDALVCAEDVSRGKPAPDPFIKAAEKLGLEPGECIAIEDSLFGIESAYRAGLIPIMIPDLIPPTEEVKKMCAAVLGSLEEVV